MPAKRNDEQQKKKKDFKLSTKIVTEFEKLAPSGKQTAIVESLIGDWIAAQRRRDVSQQIALAYSRTKNSRKKS